MRLHSSFQSDNLIIEHYELFLYHHVFVVVSEKPVLESASLSNLIEKVCQRISLVESSTEGVLDTAGAAMGNDVIYIPPCLIQRFPCSFVFIHAGQFLFPPGSVVDSVESPRGVELPELSLVVRIVWFQNTVPDVMTAGPAHGKDFLSANLGISKFYMCHLFKKITGTAIVKYINFLKAAKAKKLLVETDRSLLSVCMEVGFADTDYFSKWFKKQEGITPSAYRKLNSRAKR